MHPMRNLQIEIQNGRNFHGVMFAKLHLVRTAGSTALGQTVQQYSHHEKVRDRVLEFLGPCEEPQPYACIKGHSSCVLPRQSFVK